MACGVNGRPVRSRRRRKAKRAKWGFELDLEELEVRTTPFSCSADSGIHTASSEEGSDSPSEGMPPISRFILEGSKLETKISHIGQPDRSTFLERGGFPGSPHQISFSPSNFLSSTSLKKLPSMTRRGGDHHGLDLSFLAHKGATDHYFQYEAIRSLEGRERLLAEMEYLDHLRGAKRHRKEVVPHRAHLNLFLGGKKIEVEERFDINREIHRLKAMAMPDKARDLFHGRGIVLPPSHMSINPRPGREPLPDLDLDELRPPNSQRTHAPTLSSEPQQLTTMQNRIDLTLGTSPRTHAAITGKRLGHLPSIGKLPAGRRAQAWANRRSPILLAKEKRTISNLHARLNLSRMTREDTSLSRSQPSVPLSNRSAAWVEEQNELMKSHHRPGPILPQPVTLPTPGTEKRRSPEAPPPTTEGKTRPKKDASHRKEATVNPLKVAGDLDVPEDQMSSLRQTFQRLDTDMDGHLQFHQLQSHLPKEFSEQQENFVKQVYNITHSSTEFFGVDEFLLMNQLTDRVASLTGPAHDAYGKLDFDSLETSLINYVELFHNADTAQKGRIRVDALRELIGKTRKTEPLAENSEAWNTIMDSICLDTSGQVTRIEYLAHLPLFLVLVPPQ